LARQICADRQLELPDLRPKLGRYGAFGLALIGSLPTACAGVGSYGVAPAG
jgi:hypothetical protein